MSTVLTSVFETPIGLAHIAILASLISSHNNNTNNSSMTAHGLSTYDRFESSMRTTFSRAVYEGDLIHISACQQILDDACSKDT